ncbi:MAG: hypothetical protein CMB56_003135, partial [Methanobacteriota archaeon]
MSDELASRSNSLFAELISIVLDVDDDDRDMIRVIIAITNESSFPISNIETSIQTIGGETHQAEKSVSSIGPGLTRNFHFAITGELGHWVFYLSHGNNSQEEMLEIGPIKSDFRIGELFDEEVELAGSSIGGGVGGGLIADVFSNALGDFGKIRETIKIEMELEATPQISSRDAENQDVIVEENHKPKSKLKPPSPVSKSWDELPLSSPVNSTSLQDLDSNPEVISSALTSNSEIKARPSPPIQGNVVHGPPPTNISRVSEPVKAHSESSNSVREAPPVGLAMPDKSTASPSSPSWVGDLHTLLRSVYTSTSGPPSSSPSTKPPSGSPPSPPSGPTSGPPSSPPSGPTSGPPP